MDPTSKSSSPELNLPLDLALDVAGGQIYWTSPEDGSIYHAALDGSNVEILLTERVSPVGLALDVAGGQIYWTSQVISNAVTEGSIRSVQTWMDPTSKSSSPNQTGEYSNWLWTWQEARYTGHLRI